MSKQENKRSGDFASNLFDFLEEEEKPGNLAEIKEELLASGFEPDAETRWVNQYVSEQLRTLKAKRIQAASEARTSVLDGLRALRARGSAGVTAMVDRLLSQLQSGQLQGLEAQFSKLENPTEDDLRSLLADWVEMDKWDEKTETDKE